VSTGTDATLAAVCGMALTIGVSGAVLAVRGQEAAPTRPASKWTTRWQQAQAELPTAWRERGRWWLSAAGAAVIVVWAWTGYPVQGLVAGLAVLGLPYILHPEGSTGARIERLEALAQWLNQLAAVHQAGSTLERTIIASARNVPAALRADITRLAARLEDAWSPAVAYRAFAAEQADGVVDHVVLLFQSHQRSRGAGLSAALEALAASIGQQASDLRQVEADRAGVRKEARQVSLFTLAVVGVCMLNHAWTAPYGTWFGQLLLAFLAVMFVFALAWLRRMARSEPDPRLLAPANTSADPQLHADRERSTR
jgi:Flp pilus assembly protein TadB